MLVLALTPGIASSETWDQNLDLTIPSLEMPLTWQLDSKAKQEIMMGFECCYHNSLLESVRNEASLKSITYKSKVNLNGLRFSLFDEKKVKTYFIVVNSLDVYTTYRGLKHPRVYETNPILGKRPALGELVALKLTIGGLLWHFADDNTDDLIFPNILTTLAVINNIEVMKSVGLISY